VDCWLCLESGANRVFAELDEECEKMVLSLAEMRKLQRASRLGPGDTEFTHGHPHFEMSIKLELGL
jgi:hypothetical protein